MLTTSLRMTIHAQEETVWEVLVRLQDERSGGGDVRIVERFEGGFVRESRHGSMTMTERLIIDATSRKMTVELLNHPLYTGTVAISLIPTSVQNPMAPLELEYALRLERKSLHLQGMIRGEEEFLAGLRREMTAVRDRAEKQERQDAVA